MARGYQGTGQNESASVTAESSLRQQCSTRSSFSQIVALLQCPSSPRSKDPACFKSAPRPPKGPTCLTSTLFPVRALSMRTLGINCQGNAMLPAEPNLISLIHMCSCCGRWNSAQNRNPLPAPQSLTEPQALPCPCFSKGLTTVPRTSTHSMNSC